MGDAEGVISNLRFRGIKHQSFCRLAALQEWQFRICGFKESVMSSEALEKGVPGIPLRARR